MTAHPTGKHCGVRTLSADIRGVMGTADLSGKDLYLLVLLFHGQPHRLFHMNLRLPIKVMHLVKWEEGGEGREGWEEGGEGREEGGEGREERGGRREERGGRREGEAECLKQYFIQMGRDRLGYEA